MPWHTESKCILFVMNLSIYDLITLQNGVNIWGKQVIYHIIHLLTLRQNIHRMQFV